MIASIITALFLLGYMSATTASNFLFVSGALLIIGEIALGTFWLVAFNGVLALYVGYAIRTGDQNFLGIPIDWGTVFGMAFVELLLLAASVILVVRNARRKVTTGVESMVGQKATITEWNGKAGKVSIQGELWKATSDAPMDIAAGEAVTIAAVDGLVLKVKV
jgi:membrane-bound serine protease (ClpP class)